MTCFELFLNDPQSQRLQFLLALPLSKPKPRTPASRTTASWNSCLASDKRIKSCGRLGPEIEGLMDDKSFQTILVYLASLLGS